MADEEIPLPEYLTAQGCESWDDVPVPMRGMIQMLVKNQQLQEMAEEAESHAVQSLFDELTASQLHTLRGIFQDLGNDGTGRAAAYYHGVLTTLLYERHKVCPSCGINHEEAALTELFDQEANNDE